jgi:hypothetical protein
MKLAQRVAEIQRIRRYKELTEKGGVAQWIHFLGLN